MASNSPYDDLRKARAALDEAHRLGIEALELVDRAYSNTRDLEAALRTYTTPEIRDQVETTFKAWWEDLAD